MSTVVGKLLDVDRQARQVLDEARAYYEKTTEEIGIEKERILNKYAQKAEKHLSDLRTSEEAAVDEAISKINADNLALTSRIEKIYEGRHGEWENTMFTACINRADKSV